MLTPSKDPIYDAWHPVSALDAIGARPLRTTLLDTGIRVSRDSGGGIAILRRDTVERLPVLERHGLAWTSLGHPPDDLFAIPEFLEPDRRTLAAGPIGVATSAPRAIENFLDMAHFPFVHTDILGVEPHTEVKDYEVEISEERNEIVATRCRFYQPMASLAADGGKDVDYIYRVPHPFCSVLYKSCPSDPARMDVIALFVQPVTEVSIRAHLVMSMIDDVHSDTYMRRFQQVIFGQDKPVLENQQPKRLPLNPRAETPIRADLSGIAYRRWLTATNVNYGVIRASGRG